MQFKEYEITPQNEILRDYQIENKENIYEQWEKSDSVMLQMPTGTGKTRLFASLCREVFNLQIKYKKSFKILIVAHRTELIDQIKENIGQKYNMAHGVIKSGYPVDKSQTVQIASIQTLNHQYSMWENMFDLVIIDEAHHATADTYKKLWKYFPEAKFLGVTATPYRLSGQGFTDIFDVLVRSKPIKWFIENKYLCDYDYISIKARTREEFELLSLKEMGIDGDYKERDLTRIYDKAPIRAKLLESYLRYAKGKKGIIYTINKAHNKHISTIFQEHGIKIAAIDSETKPQVRKQYVADFKNGKIDVICNVDIFSEGFDCPDVEFIQLARPTKSLSKYLQQIGRGLRFQENKMKGLILDNVGLFKLFGLPKANRKWQYHFIGGYYVDYNGEASKSEDSIAMEGTYEEGDEDMTLIEEAEIINYPVETDCKKQEIENEGLEINETEEKEISNSNAEKTIKLLPILVNEKWGYKGENNRTVIEPRFDGVRSFNEGLAGVANYIPRYNEIRWGFIDESGKIKIRIQYNNIEEDFLNGIAAVTLNGKKTFITIEGKEIDKKIFNNESLQIIENNDNKYIYDRFNKFKSEMYDNVLKTANSNEFIVRKINKYGVWTQSKGELIPVIYEEIISDRKYYLCRNVNNWHVYDNDGKVIKESISTKIPLVGNKLKIIENNGKYGLINRYYDQILETEYDLIYDLKEDGIIENTISNKENKLERETYPGLKMKYANSIENTQSKLIIAKKNNQYRFYDYDLRMYADFNSFFGLNYGIRYEFFILKEQCILINKNFEECGKINLNEMHNKKIIFDNSEITVEAIRSRFSYYVNYFVVYYNPGQGGNSKISIKQSKTDSIGETIRKIDEIFDESNCLRIYFAQNKLSREDISIINILRVKLGDFTNARMHIENEQYYLKIKIDEQTESEILKGFNINKIIEILPKIKKIKSDEKYLNFLNRLYKGTENIIIRDKEIMIPIKKVINLSEQTPCFSPLNNRTKL